jgi:glutaredoxin-related protein
MSTRKQLSPDKILPAATLEVSEFHKDQVANVEQLVSSHAVVVVGMRMNPVVKSARRLLKEQGVDYEYLEIGSYLSEWKPRLALKLWAGWPTFPMIFVNGTLIGGHRNLKKLIDEGQWSELLSA